MKKILAADHPDQLEMLELFFRKHGYACDTAWTIEEIRRRYGYLTRPDIILLENCTAIPGLSFVREIRAHLDNTPCILFTTVGVEELYQLQKETGELGGCAIMQKPFHLHELALAIVALIGE